MKTIKSSNPVRLIAFFLTAVLLICTFGFKADGWQIGEEKENGSSNNVADKPTDNPDDPDNPINTDESENQEENAEPDIYMPLYVNRLTGLEVSEEIANGAHFAFIMDSSLPCYGISGADLVCEIPTENGTRLIAFTPESEKLWKIGALTNTRGYISNIAKYFGGICVSHSCDDGIKYNSCDISNTHLDLSLYDNYYYTEFENYVYTNSDLLYSGISKSDTHLDETESISLPYLFSDFGSEPLFYGDVSVKNIRYGIPDKSYSELSYNSEALKYSVIKNGVPLTDSINGKQVEFENCFVLFSDSVIYDNSECSQMVMDTIGNGVGYYFSYGGICKIIWSGTADGVMKFSLPDGSELTVNRGKTYLTFLRTSMKDKLIFD